MKTIKKPISVIDFNNKSKIRSVFFDEIRKKTSKYKELLRSYFVKKKYHEIFSYIKYDWLDKIKSLSSVALLWQLCAISGVLFTFGTENINKFIGPQWLSKVSYPQIKISSGEISGAKNILCAYFFEDFLLMTTCVLNFCYKSYCIIVFWTKYIVKMRRLFGMCHVIDQSSNHATNFK